MANKTFAKRAQDLIKQYSRADFDETEKNELNARLEELAAEQESYREANGMTQPQMNQMPQFNDGGFLSRLSQGDNSFFNISDWWQGRDDRQINRQINRDMNQDLNMEYNNIVGNNSNFGQSFAQSGAAQYIPSAISGVMSTIGNIRGAKRTRDHYDELSDMIQDTPKLQSIDQLPSLLNLESERGNIRKDFDDAKNMASRNIRNASKSRGEYLSATTAAQSASERNEAKALSESYLNEAKYNAAARERTEAANIANRMRADQYNVGMDYETSKLRQQVANQGFGAEQQYRDAAWSTGPQMMNDMLKIRHQNQLISSLGRDYGYVRDPNTKWWQSPQWKSQYRGL